MSHSLPRRDVCHPGHPTSTIMAIYGWSGSTALVRMLRLLALRRTDVICWSAVCFGFGYGYGRNWTSVTASLSATAETRKIVSVGLSSYNKCSPFLPFYVAAGTLRDASGALDRSAKMIRLLGSSGANRSNRSEITGRPADTAART